jgi:hypothetical protein
MSSIRFGRGREYQFFRREDIRSRWDLASATSFLNGFRSDGVAMSTFRREVAAKLSPAGQSSISDDQIIHSMARMLVTGEFVVALPAGERKPLHIRIPDVAPAPPPRPAPAPIEATEEEPTFDSDHDGVAQAAVLIEAARAAFPFCEECARHAAMQGAPA